MSAPGHDRGLRQRMDRVVASAFLAALAFVQLPGWTAADTKLDLVVDPGGFLSKALSLWDPLGAAGQLQNQAYGYLFPMGPFFWVGHASGLPAWVVQRLWWALVLVVAWQGMHRVLERLGVGDRLSRLVGAFAYALAPRMFMGLGAVSSEVWPMAVAPWILLPLLAVPPGAERRAALRSGCAVLLLGAVNAVASLATLVLPLWWILTRRSPSRRALLGWWCGSVVLATAWWVGPLLLLGRYSPPFLDWIESARVTTMLATPTEALRGTTQWLATISGTTDPTWPAGWATIASRTGVVSGLVLAAAGLLGLAAAQRPWASFARGGLLLGLVLVTFGHVGGVSPPWGPLEADALDGLLAPFRNNHKFEPVVRLPLAVGLAHGLPVAVGWLRRSSFRWPGAAVLAAVAALVAQGSAPALVGVVQRGPFTAVPSHWEEAARWIDENADGGRTLILPGGSAPARVWGEPKDEPYQPVATRPWVVRDSVPLGSAGATRLLTEIERRVAQGRGGSTLLNLLRHLGVTRVMVTGEHQGLLTRSTPPLVVRAAVVSTGARSAVSFGDFVNGSRDPKVVNDWGLERPVRAIEIFDVPTRTSVAPTERTPLSEVGRFEGGPEGVARSGLGPVIHARDRGADLADSATYLTSDTLQRRDSSFTSGTDTPPPLLSADERYVTDRAVHDYWPAPASEDRPDLTDLQTVRIDDGAGRATASSTLSVPAPGQGRALGSDPWRAFDASGETAWQSAGYTATGQWVQLTFAEPQSPPAALTAVLDAVRGADVAAFSVVTEAGSARTPISSPDLVPGVDPASYPVALRVPPGSTRWVRLLVEAVRNDVPTVRIRDLGAGILPRASASVRLPTTDDATVVSLSATADSRPACHLLASGVLACSPDRAVEGEEQTGFRRAFTVDAARTMTASGTAVPRGGGADALLGRLDGVTAEGSSRWLDVAGLSPDLVVDGDPQTYWAAGPRDGSPTLTLRWPGQRRLSGLVLSTDPDVAGRRPTRVQVEVGGETYDRTISAAGTVDLPETRASSLTVRVLATTSQVSRRGVGQGAMPVVVGDISLVGESWPAGLPRSSEVRLGCGFGPTVQAAGTTYQTEVTTTRGDVIAGAEAEIRTCSPVRVAPGDVTVQALASSQFTPTALTLDGRSEGPVSTATTQGPTVTTLSWGATSRSLDIGAAASTDTLLTVRENANDGWRASVGDRLLTPVTVDGWAQGWVVPAGTSGVLRLEFAPQRTFLLALLAGLVAALLLVAVTVGHGRPVGDALVVAPAEAGRRGRAAGHLAAGAGLVVVGGLWGLVAAAGAAVLTLAGRRGVWATLVIAAGWVSWSAWSPWPTAPSTNHGVVSGLLALTLVGLVAARGASGHAGAAVGPGLDRGLDPVPAHGGDHRGEGQGDDHGHPEPAGEDREPEHVPHDEHDR